MTCKTFWKVIGSFKKRFTIQVVERKLERWRGAIIRGLTPLNKGSSHQMSDKVIGEQFVLIGSVNVPATPESTMKYLNKLGPAGFMPGITQEVSLADGRTQNRLSFNNMSDVSINFNSDRIILTRGAGQKGEVSGEPFADLAKKLCDALEGTSAIEIKRVVLVREKFMTEYPENKLSDICRRFLGTVGDVVPFEWFARSSTFVERPSTKFLQVIEVGRAQGVIQTPTSKYEFDRVRAKVEFGTNMFDESTRYTIDQALGLLSQFEAGVGEAFAKIEATYHG